LAGAAGTTTWKVAGPRRTIRIARVPIAGGLWQWRSGSPRGQDPFDPIPERAELISNVIPVTLRSLAITVTQLTAFLAVVRGGSVTAAADELVVTQPSVSSAVAALGRELGCELFERAGRGIRLTDAGEAFRPYAADIVGLLEEGRQAAREAADVAARRLRIAAVTTAAESFVPPLMRAFSARHPDIELTLDVGNRDYVFERVLNHLADVAISGKPPADERLAAEPLLENQIACINSPDDPAAAAGPLTGADLAHRVWLLREPGSGTRALAAQFLDEVGLTPRTLTLGSNGAIKQAARAGLGVSLLSRAAAEAELESGRLGEITLADGPAPRPWFVLHSRVGPIRAPVAAFAEFAREQALRLGLTAGRAAGAPGAATNP
jgi:LysR family transcriptional regulator, low CO2-responsive transcriptional regulator